MPKHQLGDAPIQKELIEDMKAMAKAIDLAFNGKTRGADRDWGFVLLVFPFGSKAGRCNYISNGADRRDIVTLMKE